MAGTAADGWAGSPSRIPIYGFAEPLLATTIARGLFAATAVLGFILIFVLWRGEEKAETALVSWGAILVWTFLAAAAALTSNPGPSISVLLLAASARCLSSWPSPWPITPSAQGYLSRHFFREAGRHALALAGARSYVWDWQPEEGELYVSPEIERALVPPRHLREAGCRGLPRTDEPLRPDRLSRSRRGGGAMGAPVEKEFRLRHGEGGYRWFELRARAITGHGQRAVR